VSFKMSIIRFIRKSANVVTHATLGCVQLFVTETDQSVLVTVQGPVLVMFVIQ
jgi:hypothetical protein